MKVKILIAALILSIAALTQVHGFGIGAQFNFSAGSIFAPGASVVFSPSHSFHIAGNWYIDTKEKVNVVGLTFDWRPLTVKLINLGLANLNFTLDAGLYTNFKIISSGIRDVTGGARLPVGLSLMLLADIFEVYAHVAPSVGVQFVPNFDFDKPFFPMAVGARVWLF